MDVTFQQLRMLREVAHRGTIAAAAEALGYTPSAVSQQLSTVERTTGVAVLERIGRNVLLTDAGRELVVHAELVLTQMDAAAAAIERVQGDVAGTLRLGFIESIAATILGPLMSLLRERHPHLQLRTREIDGRATTDSLIKGDLDIAFVIDDPLSPTPLVDGFDTELVCRDWFQAVLPPGFFDQAELPDSISLSDLDGLDFVGPPYDDSCGRTVTQMCRRAGFEPDFVHSVSDYPTTLRLVAAGGGVALVPDLGLRDVPPCVSVIKLTERRHRCVNVMFRSTSRQRPAVDGFLAALHETVGGLGLDHDS